MNVNLILEGKATLEDLIELHETKGLEFVINNGGVTDVLQNGQSIIRLQ